jgi:protein TonB
MRGLLIPVVASAVLVCGRAEPQVVEKRGPVTYHSGEWSGSDSKHTVDAKPQPVGGMAAFLARLDYPADLRRQGITGTMQIRVALDAAGRVASAEVTHSVHPKLDAIVLRAVRETRWRPAMKGGKPVSWKFTFPVTFTRNA